MPLLMPSSSCCYDDHGPRLYELNANGSLRLDGDCCLDAQQQQGLTPIEGLTTLGQLYERVERSLTQERAAVGEFLKQRHTEFLECLRAQLRIEEATTLTSPCHVLRTEHSVMAAPAHHEDLPTVQLAGASEEGDMEGEREKQHSFSQLSRFTREASQMEQRVADALDLKPYQAIVVGPLWDVVVGLLILVNLLIMAFEMHYEGSQTAYEINYKGFSESASEAMPGWDDFFSVSEWVFGVLFTVEVVIKILVLRSKFFARTIVSWNLLDLMVVVVWCVLKAMALSEGNQAMLFRGLRLIRLVRFLQMFRFWRRFDSLFLLLRSIESSLAMLMWTLLMLLFIMVVISIFVGHLLTPFMRDPEVDEGVRQAIYEKWGSFLRALTTMFAMTLANWAPTCWELMNNVTVLWGIFFIVYKCTIGFCVLQVVTSVFIQQTSKIAARDEDIMIRDKMAAGAAHIRNLERLFERLDESRDGELTREEWERMRTIPHIQAWFAALELDVSEADELFDLLDDGDGKIQQGEFIKSMKYMKRHAKCSDLMAISADIRKLKVLIESVRSDVTDLRQTKEQSKEPRLCL